MDCLNKCLLMQNQQILSLLLLLHLLFAPAIAASIPVEVTQTFQGHRNTLAGAAYSPDGTTIAVASGSYIHLLNANSGETIKVLSGPAGEINQLHFVPDGKTLFSSSWNEKQVWMWDLTGGTLQKSFSDAQQLNVLAVSQDGTLLVTASNQSPEAKVWDVVAGKVLQVLKAHRSSVRTALFTPDGTLLTAGDDLVVAWNPRTGQQHFKLPGHLASQAMALSPDGKMLAVATNANQTIPTHQVKVWNVVDQKLMFTVSPKSDLVLCMAFSPNGQNLAVCSSSSIELYDTSTHELTRTLGANSGPLNSLNFSPDGKTLATSSWDGTLKVWGMEDHKPRLDRSPSGNSVSAIALSPDGRWIATGGKGPDAKLWNATTGQLVQTLKDSTFAVNALVFSWDSQVLITASVNALKLWEVPSGRLLTELKGSGNALPSIQQADLSPDGRFLLVASDDNTAKIWDVQTGTLLHTLSHPDAVDAAVFSPDGKKIATTSRDHTLRFWDAQNGRETTALAHVTTDDSKLSFSLDGALLALTQPERNVELYDPRLGIIQKTHLLKIYKTDTLEEVMSLPVSSPTVQFGKGNTLLVGSVADCKVLQQLDVTTRHVLQEYVLSSCAGNFTVSRDGKQLASTYGQVRDASSATLYQVKPPGQAFLPMGIQPAVAAAATVPLESPQAPAQQNHPAPTLRIVSPASGSTWSREQVPVLVTTNQEGMTYQVYLNDVLQSSKAVGVTSSKNQTLMVNLPANLQDGQSVRVTVVGQAPDGQSSDPTEVTLKWKAARGPDVNPSSAAQTNPPTLTPANPPTNLPVTGTRKLWVLTVGVGAFENTRITPLTYAAKDARDFAAFWATQKGPGKPFDDVEVQALTDQGASRRSIVTALTRILEEADSDDTVIWFFSTHGINYRSYYYITTHDTDISSPAALQATAMDQDQLMGMLRRSMARVWMFLDTCHAGLATGFKEASSTSDPLVNSLKAVRVDAPENRQPIIFAATRGNDVAYENSSWSNGAFTKALLEGLSGKAANGRGEVKMFGLLSYVADRVEELTSGNQHPNVQQTSDNVVMAVP